MCRKLDTASRRSGKILTLERSDLEKFLTSLDFSFSVVSRGSRALLEHYFSIILRFNCIIKKQPV